MKKTANLHIEHYLAHKKCVPFVEDSHILLRGLEAMIVSRRWAKENKRVGLVKTDLKSFPRLDGDDKDK